MADYGFVNEVVKDAEERAVEFAAEIASGPPLAQRVTKQAMLSGRNDIEAGLDAEATGFGLLWTADDTFEGIDAFVNEREPSFEGE